MDQTSIVRDLGRKGLTAMKIDNNLGVTLGHDAKGDSSVTRFLGQAKFPSPNHPIPFSEENRALDDSLTEQPFASLRQLSRLGHLP
jgi:hypothetical protein